MLERDIEKKVTAIAKANGWLAYKFVSPSCRGVPDRIYFKDGETLLVEFKAPGKKPTPLQASIIKKIKAQGIRVEVIDNIEVGCELFD
jgi:hypothetical protein